MSENYPSNAKNIPQARQKQVAVVRGVQVRKKPLLDRIHDRGTGIFKDVLFEVVGPYFRDMFADSFYSAIDRAFYPEGGVRTRNSRPGGGYSPPAGMSASGYVVTDYNAQYNTGPTSGHVTQRTPFDFSQFTFPDYAAGREACDRLIHVIDSYGHATANDLYDLLGMTGSLDGTGEHYGWQGRESLAGMEVRKVRGGRLYYLAIPDPKPLLR